MKLQISRDSDSNILLKMKIDKETIDFEYPVFIERLFEGDSIDPSQYSKDISADEKMKLDKMLEEMKGAIKKYKNALTKI